MSASNTPPYDAKDHAAIIAHMGAVAPLLTANFGAIPIAYVTYPHGLGHHAVYHRRLEETSAAVPTVTVRTAGGVQQYATLSVATADMLARERFAVELQSWSPTAADPLRAAFARLTVEPSGRATAPDLSAAMFALRGALNEKGLEGIPLLDGGHGFALWIPLAGGPTYDDVTSWLHRFVAEVVSARPDLLTNEDLRGDRGDRIYIGLRSNHPGMMSVLPYTARGASHLPIALPLLWSEVGSARNGDVTAATFPAWFAANGDRFATIYAALKQQKLPQGTALNVNVNRFLAAVAAGSLANDIGGDAAKSVQDHVLEAALKVLGDGKERSADEILHLAVTIGLLSEQTTRKQLYTDLYEYVMRTLGAGKQPQILEDPTTKKFRINRPVDTWPDVAMPALARWLDDATVEELVARVTDASTGSDPEAFEIAVCDAFAALGFTAQHIGGNGRPDGTLDAQLGELGYRVILECKTAKPGGVVSNPRPEEPASFRAAYNGQKALLIGPAFSDEASLRNELINHGVSLWTTADLVAMLRAQVGPSELTPAFEPGYGRRACDLILWAREHGLIKHLVVLRERILAAGWKVQAKLAGQVPPAESPLLTRDAIFVLVDEMLMADGVAGGATRAEFSAAFLMLLSNRQIAVGDAAHESFVVRQPVADA